MTLGQEELRTKLEQATEQQLQTEDQIQLIVFKLGEEEYGLHIDQIKEVVLTPNVTAMPETQAFIKGVANIRGNIISIVDLEERFGVTQQKSAGLGKYTLVVASEEFKIGILVKEVPNTLAIYESNIENVNGMIDQDNVDAGYIRGIVKKEGRLIIMIDIYKVMQKEEIHALHPAT